MIKATIMGAALVADLLGCWLVWSIFRWWVMRQLGSFPSPIRNIVLLSCAVTAVVMPIAVWIGLNT
ncbi:MAG TPA: hypothetical protein VGI95_13630 [Caulobacteraceae bacterium]|jgi:hypothetical protein